MDRLKCTITYEKSVSGVGPATTNIEIVTQLFNQPIHIQHFTRPNNPARALLLLGSAPVGKYFAYSLYLWWLLVYRSLAYFMIQETKKTKSPGRF